MIHLLLLPDGALGEHIRFAFKIALLVDHFQGTEQIIGRISGKGQGVAAGIDKAEFLREAVIQAVQFRLLFRDCRVRVIVQLGVHQVMDAIPQGYHALHPFQGGSVQIGTHHDGVLPEIHLPVFHGIGVVFYVGVSGDAFGDRLVLAQFG